MSDKSSKAGLRTRVAGHRRLLDQVREMIRRKSYNRCTEEAYVHWTKCFICFAGTSYPATIGALWFLQGCQWSAFSADP